MDYTMKQERAQVGSTNKPTEHLKITVELIKLLMGNHLDRSMSWRLVFLVDISLRVISPVVLLLRRHVLLLLDRVDC